MHQYDLVSRTGDDRPAFLLSARGRGPPATRKMTELTNKKLLNLQEEYFMKKFIKKITHTAKSAVTCVKTAVGNSMSAQKTAIDALRFDPKDSELNMYAILTMGFQGNLSMAQTYYTAAKPYLALEHAEVIKKYLNIK